MGFCIQIAKNIIIKNLVGQVQYQYVLNMHNKDEKFQYKPNKGSRFYIYQEITSNDNYYTNYVHE